LALPDRCDLAPVRTDHIYISLGIDELPNNLNAAHLRRYLDGSSAGEVRRNYRVSGVSLVLMAAAQIVVRDIRIGTVFQE
jgi:hypothetical protein